MSFKVTCLTAVTLAFLYLGCGSKSSETVPTTAPAAAEEPAAILKNLQYLGTQKDLKHLDIITPSDSNVAYEAACRLHKHAGEMDIVLRDQDIMDLGVTDLRTRGYLMPGVSLGDALDAKAKNKALPWMAKVDMRKLDQLPVKDTLPDGRPDPDYHDLKSRYAIGAAKAGIFRVVTGVPDRLWAKLSVSDTKPDARSADIQDVTIGLKGSAVLQVAVIHNKVGGYGICGMTLLMSPKQLITLPTE